MASYRALLWEALQTTQFNRLLREGYELRKKLESSLEDQRRISPELWNLRLD